jgi:hypothetical protein
MAFREGYLNQNVFIFKKKLKSAKTSYSIFNILIEMIGRKIIPFICPIKECAECLGINTVDTTKLFEVSAVLELSQFSDEEMEILTKGHTIYVKVTEDQLYNFRLYFLTHNVSKMSRVLAESNSPEEVLRVLYDFFVSTAIYPVFWPIKSKFDLLERVDVNFFLLVPDNSAYFI